MSEHRHNAINEDVDAIIQLAQEYDLDALTIVDGEFELSITRREPIAAAMPVVPHVAQSPEAIGAPVAAPVAVPSQAEAAAGNVVAAPIIGVFYRASSPDAAPFVNVGDRVTVGQTLCILEAMKLMNEITSDFNGVVLAIHVENSDLVTIGQPIFTIGHSLSA